jgi:ribosomal protein S12 methylthiotransferase
MYAYPNRFPWELTRLLREHPRVLPYLDIPIQHAATNVLRAMKRAGSGEQVRATLERLRAEVPGIELRTTVLLGFPGETEADAQELVDFVREGEIARLGAFTWSAEEGTSAFELPGRVDPQVANERRDAVLRARDAVLERRQRALVGRELLVLVDESHATRAVGRTRADAPEVDLLAVIEDSRAPVGARVRVRVTATDEQHNLICAEVAAPR